MGEGHGSDAPKVRELPAPRRNESVIGPLFRWVFTWPYRVALAGLYRAGFRPWMLTTLSLLTNVVVGWLLITRPQHRFLPGILLLPAGLFDIFDGGVARMRGEESRWGAFLDSVMDRLSDAIVFGALYWSLLQTEERTTAALTLAALVVSLAVSHLRAEAEAHGLELSEGFFQRLERYVALMIGLTAPGFLLPIMAILVALGVATVIQRIVGAWRQLPILALTGGDEERVPKTRPGLDGGNGPRV